MKVFRLSKANVLRSLCFFLLLAAVTACAQEPTTPTRQPQPTPTTRVIVLVATNAPANATTIPSPTTPAFATSQPATATPAPTTEPTQALVPTRVPPTKIPPTRVLPTATHIPPTKTTAPTAIPATKIPTIEPTLPPTAHPTFAPTAAQTVSPPTSFAPSELVYIPEGTLRMGGNAPEDDPDEKPPHDVHMYDYHIEKDEVTNSQYQACVAVHVCPPPTKNGSYTRASYFGDPAFANYPVVNVTWNGADQYCKWIGRRLPNEAEWERAAKGTENWRYTWSNSIGMHFEWNAIFHGSPISFCEASCPLPNYWGDVNDGFADTAPVGQFSQYDSSSGFGVIDMAGNVAEWTNNWYDGNAYSDGNDIYGPNAPTGSKVVRGGSWADEPRRNSDREPHAPDYSSDRIGFRCAQ